jgi:TetR/AcrR family tetracycline transcriptional repressor
VGRLQQRRPGGVQPGGVGRTEIVDAAVRVAHRYGLAGLSMSRVAAELGVTSPALYHHHRGGLAALVEAVVVRVANTIHETELTERPDETWFDTLERVLLATVRIERQLPGVVRYLLGEAKNTPISMRGSEFIVGLLIKGGFSITDAAHAYGAVYALVAGWATTEAAEPAAARSAGFRALADVRAAQGDLDWEDELRMALRALLYGLCATLPSTRRTTGARLA